MVPLMCTGAFRGYAGVDGFAKNRRHRKSDLETRDLAGYARTGPHRIRAHGGIRGDCRWCDHARYRIERQQDLQQGF
jgi:hypothetical protein